MNDNMHFAHVDRSVQPPFQYKACGLDNVYLTGGYKIENIGGETFVAVKDAEDLQKAIAHELVTHRKVLRGQEVRFLRKFLDLTQARLGAKLGISDQAVARYEKDKVLLEGPADTLMRVYVLGRVLGMLDPSKEIEGIRNNDCLTDMKIILTHELEGWKTAA